MLKLVIFDMDGLMLDTEQLHLRAFVETCLAFGQTPRPALYRSAVGIDDEGETRLYQDAFPHIGGQIFHRAMSRRCQALIDRGAFTTKPGLFALFDAIERRGGLRTAVVTASYARPAQAMLTRAGILPDHLNGGVYRDMVARAKPFPDAHLLCCDIMGVTPQEALVLEDSEPGICAALAAGIPVIAIPDLVEPSADVLARCLARCDRLEQVIPYLN